MLLKSLTEALRKQKQSNSLLENKLAKSSLIHGRHSVEEDDGGPFSNTATRNQIVSANTATSVHRRMSASNSRGQLAISKAQVEVPPEIASRSNSASPGHSVPIMPAPIETGGRHGAAVSGKGGHKKMGAMTAPVGLQPMSKDGFQSQLAKKEESSHHEEDLLAKSKQSSESRDLMKRSFMMQANSIDNITATPETEAVRTKVNNGKYFIESETQGSTGGRGDTGFNQRGPRGSRLGTNKQPTTSKSKTTYDARLF